MAIRSFTVFQFFKEKFTNLDSFFLFNFGFEDLLHVGLNVKNQQYLQLVCSLDSCGFTSDL
jgi:hypothetical protein